MNITLIYGSPRKNGNSDKLGNAFVKGALMSGHNIKEFYIRDMNIQGCIGCEYCYTDFGQCSLNDDMYYIYKSLYSTECLIFVTPIYYQNFPSQMKAVIDRLYISENKPFAIKKACLLSTYASKGKKWYKQLKRNYYTLIKYHGWKNVGVLFVEGMDEVDDIDNSPALEQAMLMGKNI